MLYCNWWNMKWNTKSRTNNILDKIHLYLTSNQTSQIFCKMQEIREMPLEHRLQTRPYLSIHSDKKTELKYLYKKQVKKHTKSQT